MEWLSYQDLRIQLAIYGPLVGQNNWVKRCPVSHPLAETGHAPQQWDQPALEFTCGWCPVFPSAIIWRIGTSSASEDVFFIDIASTLRFLHPEMSSQEGKNMFIRPGVSILLRRLLIYMLTGTQVFNHIPLWPSVIKQMDWARQYYGNITC